ncbi:MAG: alpha-mannosidase, partial [Candidatus Hydrogenedentes bacterium]|nr:alpha-mannosidase [Candidatus Hydrogenedentota bacterium]
MGGGLYCGRWELVSLNTEKDTAMRTRIVVLVLTMCLLVSWAVRAEELWRIGVRDADYGEFAAAGAYQEFSAAFAGGVVYTIGKSAPGKDWPYIQPGPVDAWAGSKSHSFQVLFNLKRVPKTGCRLIL